jgi:hypothetical protein
MRFIVIDQGLNRFTAGSPKNHGLNHLWLREAMDRT